MAAPHRTAGVPFRDRIGSPLIGNAPKVMLLGSGELGREIAIEAMRLGAEVIAVDRYANAPAMQVAHRHRVLAMTDRSALRALVQREAPDVIVPEIEQIATDELVRLEEEGWTVIPRAESTRATMDRERIRRLAAEKARVRTSRFEFAENAADAARAATAVGYPCIFKAMMSSSGHGMSVVRSAGEVEAAYAEASEHGRVRSARVMIEEFIPFDREVTMLTLRHYDPAGHVVTTVMEPIAHQRPSTLYHESWQPEPFAPEVLRSLNETSTAVTDQLGGIGLFGVECFVRGSTVYFSEVSPRPHDTGLVTLGSQWNSEFALHARAILGLPYLGPEPTTPTAAHVILAPSSGWAPSFGGLTEALSPNGVRIFLFGKPEAYPDRRMGVAVARASTTASARRLAEHSAHVIEAQLRTDAPRDVAPVHP
jgi:phosphoribosylglycinamide formyltransferase 2